LKKKKKSQKRPGGVTQGIVPEFNPLPPKEKAWRRE
jgi:hypothetical protein